MADVLHPLLILRPRPWKWVGLLAISLLFVTGGWLMVRDDKGVAGWFVGVFFGLCAIVFMVQMIPGASRLVVTTMGLYVRHAFRQWSYAWPDIERFGVHEWTQWHGPFRQRHRQVGVVLRDAHGSHTGKLHMLTRAMSGFDGTLPDNYGYKHQELADLLNSYLKNHGDRKD